MQVAVFSVVSIQFPESKVLYIGYCESASGVGLMAGPIVGQAFFSVFGFEGCFYATTGLLAMAGVLQWFLIPDSVNRGKSARKIEHEPMDVETVASDEEEEEEETKFTLAMILSNKKVALAFFSMILATVFLLYTEPTISDRLIEIGVSQHYIGYIFASACLAYALSAPLVGYLTTLFSKESLALFAFVMSGILLLV